MHHSLTLDDLPRDGERLDLTKISKVNGILLGVGAVGGLISLCYLLGIFDLGSEVKHRQHQFAYSWLFAFFFFFTITNGGIFWTMLQHISNSGWSVAVRRLFENLGGNVKWMAVFALPFLLIPGVRDSLYEWFTVHHHAAEYAKEHSLAGGTREGLKAMHEATLAGKYLYLNTFAWYLRAVLYFAFLIVLIGLLRKWSIQQDQDGDFKHTFRSRALCAFPLLIYALVVTFSAVDWVMSMDYTWFSTMWGVYIFAGGAWAAMAVSILALNYVRGNGYLQKVVTGEHYHLMGKLLLAFTIFWAYIAFSQFFLIWYANITEETRFYLLRNTEGWNTVAWMGLLVGHFVVSFILLLSAGRKKQTGQMNWVCAWVLLMHLVDWYWLVIPERAPSLTHGESLWIPGAWFGDVVAFLTIGGLVSWAYLRRLAKASLYPCRDPRLLESVTCSN